MPEKNGSKTISLTLAITMIFAAATGAWAISTEVHNYRLSNLTKRADAGENLAMDHDRTLTTLVADMGFIKSALSRLLESHDG